MRHIGLFFGLLLALLAAPSLAEAQSRLVTSQLRSVSFGESRIGVSPLRNVTVYLPPHYADGSRRFPVIYYLNHFFEDHREPFASHDARALFDKAIGAGVIGDVIVVTADFSTPAGSSWYVNSSATGNWEDFMVRELVPWVDATYRTLATRDSRGVAGDGVGGYGAVRFGMRHPEVFGTVYAMQAVGTGPGVQTTYSRPNFDLLARARSLDDLGDDSFSRIFTAIYQAFSPNPDRPPLYFDPPARRVDGQLLVDSAVMKRFHEDMDLAGLVPDYADNLKSLRGLKIDWGRGDTIADHIAGNQALSRRLAEFGVPHEAEEHAGGFRDRHWGEDGRVYTDVLPFFARHLLFGPPTAPRDRVTAAHGRLGAAMIAGDADALAALYLPDAISMPEYQPALYGRTRIAAYQRAMSVRRRVTGYVPVAAEVIDLGKGVLVETGLFTIAWRLSGGGIEEERGKYVNVWSTGPDGALKLKADVRGYLRPLADPSSFVVALPAQAPPASPAGGPLAARLDALNRANARAVQDHDVAAQLALYADDGMFMPFANTPRAGIAELRPFLTAYVNAGRGATFDSVRVWNTGFEDFGGYVLEYGKFRVAWRAGGSSGVTRGGGLRLWRRGADGALTMLRQIGTHDHAG